NVPSDLRLAHKILKNAGFLPPEVELKKKITQTEHLLETAQIDSPKRAKIQKKLNYLLTKLSITRGDRPCSPVLSNEYQSCLIKKIS
ncbi:MAG: DnaJ family domain-containing protein, partial [Thermodesulfobacteriota bacterium]